MQKGITLIETVVAVTVLIFALGGPFLLAAKSLHTAAYAREEITASRLAEEGLEIVHNIRDNNSAESDVLPTPPIWLNLIDNGSGTNCATSAGNQECFIDITKQLAGGLNATIWNATAVNKCGAVVCTNSGETVYQSPAGFYAQFPNGNVPSGWKATSMKRVIRVMRGTTSPENREYTVVSEVTYIAGGGVRKVTLTDTLLNWFPELPIQ